MATNTFTDPKEATTTYNQPTLTPTAKVKAVGGVGMVIAAIVTLLTLTGVTVPEGLPEQAEAAWTAGLIVLSFIQAVIQFAAGYFKKSDTANGVSKKGL